MPRLLRTMALAIAALGALDPAISTERFARSEVAVVTADPVRDARLGAEVSRALSKSFTVTDAPWAKTSATVIVGEQLPAHYDALAGRLFAVTPDHRDPAVYLDAVVAPATAPMNGRVAVRVQVRTIGARGRSLDLVLRDGNLVVDHLTLPLTADSARLPLSLSFVPVTPGPATLRVTATISGSAPDVAVTADAMVDVREKLWAVLFYDARPSWMSTFVRRAIERDDRFVVTSRVMTSRNISTDAGRPPAGLTDAAPLGLFDVVVVGAPEALGDGDVAGLDRFLRRRGGQVVLLLDDRGEGPYRRLLDVRAWRGDSGSKVFAVSPGDTTRGVMHASEMLWPAQLPAGATVVAHTDSNPADGPGGRALVWQSPVGAGELLVSGALDAWRFRDPAVSGFDRFWRATIADAAAATLPALDLRLSPTAIAPADSSVVTVTIRDAMLQDDTQPIHATVSASLESADGAGRAVRLWPGSGPGQFVGVVRGAEPGKYRLVVTSAGQRAEASLLVGSGVERARGEGADLLGTWVGARGGAVITASQLPELTGRIRRAIGSAPHRERWHPMRSPWWIVPFATLLSLEWWLRRRRGLA